MFIVRKDNPGLIVNKQLDKHGWRCSDTAELFFQDCEVEESDVLGTINKCQITAELTPVHGKMRDVRPLGPQTKPKWTRRGRK